MMNKYVIHTIATCTFQYEGEADSKEDAESIYYRGRELKDNMPIGIDDERIDFIKEVDDWMIEDDRI